MKNTALFLCASAVGFPTGGRRAVLGDAQRAVKLCASSAPAEEARALGQLPAANAVFLTRERGKNDKLARLLAAASVPTCELPCIAFQILDAATDTLPATLAAAGAAAETETATAAAAPATAARGETAHLEWVIITSPEAASVFLTAWATAGHPSLRVATVGAATAQALAAGGIRSRFEPSKATAKTLAAELPLVSGAGPASILYPCSALAGSALEEGLASRGARVTRLETYTTLAPPWGDEEYARATSARYVAFGSPSAVRTWAERVGVNATAVCIGETSASECRRLGWPEARLFYPDKPGVDGWGEAVVRARLVREAVVRARRQTPINWRGRADGGRGSRS